MAKRVEITIDTAGNYTTELFGYEGSSCATQNKSLEVLLGGEVTAEKKKPEYFEGEGDAPVKIEF